MQLVRRAWEIYVSRGVDAALGFFTDDCVMEDFPELPDHAVYVGKDGVREINRHFREMWGEFVEEPVEFIDAGEDLIVAVIATRGRALGSGTPLNAQAVWVHELHGGKIVRMRAFTTKSEAFRALSLSR